MKQLLASALVLSAALAAPALAGPKPLVAIVAVEAPPTMMGLAAQVTKELLSTAQKQGTPLLTPDEVESRLGEKPYQELQHCIGANFTCVVNRLAALKADRAVVGTLGRDEKNYLVKLWLIDLSSGEVITDVDRSILIASRRLTQDVSAAVPGLLRGEKEARGTLRLTSNARGAAVTINGEPRGLTPLTLELKPGKHSVRLEKKAYLPVERLITVEAGRVTDEQLRLIVAPGQVPEEEAPPPPVVAETQGAGQGLVIPSAGWVAGGVAFAAAVTGTVLGVSAYGTERSLKAGFDPASGIYQGTRSEALLAQRNTSLANLTFIVAGAALATGAVVTLLGQPEAPGPKAVLAPVAGPHGGGLSLGGSF